MSQLVSVVAGTSCDTLFRQWFYYWPDLKRTSSGFNLFMCQSFMFATLKKSVCWSTHQYSVKCWRSSSSLNMAKYCHSGIITQSLYHQLLKDRIAFQHIMGLWAGIHTEKERLWESTVSGCSSNRQFIPDILFYPKTRTNITKHFVDTGLSLITIDIWTLTKLKWASACFGIRPAFGFEQLLQTEINP